MSDKSKKSQKKRVYTDYRNITVVQNTSNVYTCNRQDK